VLKQADVLLAHVPVPEVGDGLAIAVEYSVERPIAEGSKANVLADHVEGHLVVVGQVDIPHQLELFVPVRGTIANGLEILGRIDEKRRLGRSGPAAIFRRRCGDRQTRQEEHVETGAQAPEGATLLFAFFIFPCRLRLDHVIPPSLCTSNLPIRMIIARIRWQKAKNPSKMPG